MTRKDFELIARTLKDAKPEHDEYIPTLIAAEKQWGKQVNYFAAVLAEEYPRFDAPRFRKACGLIETA